MLVAVLVGLLIIATAEALFSTFASRVLAHIWNARGYPAPSDEEWKIAIRAVLKGVFQKKS